jgi:hypothetical protein
MNVIMSGTVEKVGGRGIAKIFTCLWGTGGGGLAAHKIPFIS